MFDNEPATLEDDEPILRAPYSGGWWWVGVMAGAFFSYAAVHGLYSFPAQGAYFKTACAIIGILAFPPLFIDILLAREVVFYRDRVEKVWHLLGRRTIPYVRGEVRGPAAEFRWLQRGYTIREVGPNEKRLIVQIPIYYHARFVDGNVAKQVDAIMAYMAGNDLTKPTRFTKALLSEEVMHVE